MIIQFEIDENTKLKIDELTKWYGLDNHQGLFEGLLEDAYNYMKEDEDFRNWEDHRMTKPRATPRDLADG